MLDVLIKDEAKQFYDYGDWKRYDHTPTGFKDGLELQLYNHNSSTSKLFYLYEVLRLIREEYNKHLERCQHKDEPMKCHQNKEWLKMIYYTEQIIENLNPEFDFQILRPELNTDLIHENLKKLSDYPDSAKLYQSALDKLNEGINERNVLDDLRLSYELLLKSLLSNNKSLENQNSELGKYLKEQDISAECRNMFQTLNNYFQNYHNSYIKHNDKVQTKEVDLIVNLTSSLINFVISNST